MTRRAQNKKAARQFKVGDQVTWGRGVINHPVIEVRPDGVIVDGSSAGSQFSRTFVSFTGNGRLKIPKGATHACVGPPRHIEKG